jgi:hypothetical protein
MAMSSNSKIAGRIEALDYLRGFFILVIIVDHLWRWPNLFQYASGRGELWVSAAEGFVMISGLLVGYVRGYKGLKKPFAEISKKLIARGLMLGIWAIITTILIVTASWTLVFRSNIAYVPIAQFDWWNLIVKSLTLQYTHTLSHFLYLYALFLVAAPLLVWLLRRRQWWIGGVISVGLFVLGTFWKIESLQWQLLFFLPAIAGFYLDSIIAYCRRIPPWLIWTFISVGAASVIWSALVVLPIAPGWYHTHLFSREPLAPARIGLAVVWFITLAYLFNKGLQWLEHSVGWLLMPFGTRSLTAYIVHSLPLMLIALFIPATNSFILNSLIAALAILATWTILKIPNLNKVIPR